MEQEAKNTQGQKFELTSDNILHCLIHAATREDIAELRAENKANIAELRTENKANIDGLRVELKADISRLDDKLDAKASKTDMVEFKSELKSDMNEIRQEMQALRKDNNKYFRWIVGLMFGSFAGIALMILKFPLIK